VSTLLYVVAQNLDLPVLRLHATAISQMLLGAAAAALGLYGSTAVTLADKCLTAALGLLLAQAYDSDPDVAAAQAQVCRLSSRLIGCHKLFQQRQQQQQQQQPSQQAGSVHHPPCDPASTSSQTMGLGLQVMQQLRLIIDKEQASSDGSISCAGVSRGSSSSGAAGSASSSSSSGGGGGTAAATSGAGCDSSGGSDCSIAKRFILDAVHGEVVPVVNVPCRGPAVSKAATSQPTAPEVLRAAGSDVPND
jgi:hypothetical protein